jgi:uncharacterized SAM-binding protein YcdF (DUF218 family)
MRTIRRSVLVITIMLIPAAIGFARFAGSLPRPTDNESRTDAIVVLTGGSDRIAAGLALLAARKADRLFVSGVHPGVSLDDLLRANSATPAQAALASSIDLGDTAGDTFGNSVETVDWMRANHFRSMRLVTADYHMRRALIEFRMEAPDLTIIPNPIRPSTARTDEWWRDRAAFSLLLGEYGKYLVARWRYAVLRLTQTA